MGSDGGGQSSHPLRISARELTCHACAGATAGKAFYFAAVFDLFF